MRPLPAIVVLGLLVGAFAGGCSRPAPPASPAPRPQAAAAPAPVPPPATDAPPAAPDKPGAPPAAPRPAAEATTSADPVAALRAELAAATEEDARVAAIDALADIGQNAKAALGELVPLLDHENIRTRWHAARTVGMIGEDAIAVMPKIVDMLGDADPIVAAQAAAAIARIRRDDGRPKGSIPRDQATAYEAAVKALIDATLHRDGRVRRSALQSLTAFDLPPDVLAPLVNKQLGDADPSVVLPAIHSLADMGAVAVPLLMESLKNPRSRYWAELALAEIGPAAAPAIDLLVKTLVDGEPEERVQAILALGAIGEAAKPAAGELVQALTAQDRSLQLAAAFALGKIRAPEADGALEKLTTSPDSFVASIAAWARSKLRPDDEAIRARALEALSAGLASPQGGVRTGSISALSELAAALDDTACSSLAESWVRALTDADPEVQTAAAAALVRLGTRAVPALAAALDDPQRRLLALELLGGIGGSARPALERLIALLSNDDPHVAGDAALAIAAIGPAASPAVEPLMKMLADPASAASGPQGEAAGRQRVAAIYALGRIGAAARPAIPRLRELSTSADEFLTTVATWAALKISPDDSSLFESAVPLLRRALRGNQELARLEAAVALGDMGTAADSAIPLLELVSEDDSSPAVRAAAAAAVQKIRGR